MAKRTTLAALLAALALGCETMDSCKDGLCGKGSTTAAAASSGGAVAIPAPPANSPTALTGAAPAPAGMGAAMAR